jgi:lipopolysaccharide/colanic/teichoic acid biosynthesis glycosyltransferase
LTRLLDVALAAAGLLLLTPVLAAIAVAVKLTSRGPVLYRAERVGKGGRSFTLFKFRSMSDSASSDQPRLTRRGDVRVTPVGRILRRWKLDELPQLYNVLRGDMSLVGPRPEDPKYVALYTADERRVLAVRPGITSSVSLAYRDEDVLIDREDWEQHYIGVIMRDKLRRELADLDRRSIASYLGVIMRTLWTVFRRSTD